MNSKIACAIAMVGLASLPAPAHAAGTLAAGRKNFMTWCAPCHGASGTGNGPVASELTRKPADLTLIARNAGGAVSKARVKRYIDGRTMPRAHGTPQMPVWGRVFSLQAIAGGLLQEDRKGIEANVNERLDSLMIYLKTIQK